MMAGGGDTSAIVIYVYGEENTRKREAQTKRPSVLNPVKAFLPSRPCAHPTHTVPVALSGKNEEEKKIKTTMEGKKTQTGRHATRSRVGFGTSGKHGRRLGNYQRRRLVGLVLQAGGGLVGGGSEILKGARSRKEARGRRSFLLRRPVWRKTRANFRIHVSLRKRKDGTQMFASIKSFFPKWKTGRRR